MNLVRLGAEAAFVRSTADCENLRNIEHGRFVAIEHNWDFFLSGEEIDYQQGYGPKAQVFVVRNTRSDLMVKLENGSYQLRDLGVDKPLFTEAIVKWLRLSAR